MNYLNYDLKLSLIFSYYAWSIFNNFFFINLFNYYYLSIFVLDVSNQANLLLVNLKEIIDNLQTEKNYFKNQVEKLQIEKKQLIISNKDFSNKLNFLKEDLKRKASQLV